MDLVFTYPMSAWGHKECLGHSTVYVCVRDLGFRPGRLYDSHTFALLFASSAVQTPKGDRVKLQTGRLDLVVLLQTVLLF